MMSLVDQVNTDYRRMLISSLDGKTAKQQMEALNNEMLIHKFTIQDKPFPAFLKPFFAEQKTKDYFRRATELTMSSIEKVADLFFSDEKYRELLELAPLEYELARIDPHYPRRQIVARLDAFFMNDGTLKFLEFNCDSPSGMGWHDQLVKLYANLPIIKNIEAKYRISKESFLDDLCSLFVNKYRQVGGQKEKPNIVIVCKRDSTVFNDVELIIEYCSKVRGHKTTYADPRDFEYDGTRVLLNGETVDVVYRDAIQDFTDYWNDVQPIIQAYRDGKVCLINPFSSRVGGLKSVLAIMTDEKMQKLFTPEEQEAIKAYIPWTRLVKEGKTKFNNKKIDLMPYLTKNKDMFVLKPNSGYGGAGVMIGHAAKQVDWDAALEKTKTANWVIQEYLEIPKEPFPEFTPNLTFSDKNCNINFFAFDGEFAGGFVRVSSSSIINIHRGGGLVLLFYVSQ